MTKAVVQVYAVILVITLYYGGKCSSLTLIQKTVSATGDDDVNTSSSGSFETAPEELSPMSVSKNHVTDENTSRDQFTHTVNVKDLLTEPGNFDWFLKDLSSRYETKEIAGETKKRVTRQAYPGYSTSIYPQLPSAPNTQYQPYSGYNHSPHNNQPNYPPPSNPQWQPNNNPLQPYDPSGRQSSYNPSYPSYNTSQSVPPTGSYPPYNPTPGSGYRPPNSGFPSNATNYRPHGQSHHQHFNNNSYPGYPPYSSIPVNHTVPYNPSQRPPYYPPGNQSLNPYQPNYSPHRPHNSHPVVSFNTTTQRSPYNLPGQYPSYNSSKHYPSYPPGTTQMTNTSYSNYPGGRPSHNPQNNYNRPPQYGPGFGNTTTTFNGPNQRWPNNLPSNGNYPPPNYNNPGYQPYGAGHSANNSAVPYHTPPHSSPANGQYPSNTNFYPQNAQYNGSSTYRLAEAYNPNIPNQPPYAGHSDQNNFYYPPNRNGTAHDPTRVSLEHFSYH